MTRVEPSPGTGPGFTLLSPSRTGVFFTNHLAEVTAAFNRIYENGSGVALGDVDGDGWCDIYLCRLEGDNALYRNLGDWRFEDITVIAGVACAGQYSTGAAFADLDGDGDSDLLVNGLGAGTRTFINDGRGRFTEVTSRLNRTLGATSLALADVDGDGDLDLYVTNYRKDTWQDRPRGLVVEAEKVGGRVVVSPADRFLVITERAGGVELMERGDRDYLYINDGRGGFAPVSWPQSFFDEAGNALTGPPTDWGLFVLLRDLNADRLPDIFVCNDFFFWPDRIWLNDQGSRFRALPPLALRSQPVSSMGADVADINRDGHDDFFVADMVSRRHDWRHRQRPNLMQGILTQRLDDAANRPEVARNALQLNRGDHTWADIAQLAGVDFTEWSWGAVFLDVDLDGWEDLLIPTGNLHDVQDADVLRAQRAQRRDDSAEGRLRAWRQFPPLATPILGYRNNRDLTFTEHTAAWGFGEPGPWQGMALADLDNDGDQDVVVNRLNGAAGLYRNDCPAPRLAVRLQGLPPNTAGIGARIEVAGGPVTQSQQIIAGGRYLSGDQPLRPFAAGSATNRLRVEVVWRRGHRSVVTNVPANAIVEIFESASTPDSAQPTPAPVAWFEDVSARVGHRHREDSLDDFAVQPLLSRRLSTLGPSVAWSDLDADGWEDLIVGGGRGQPVTAFRNQRGRAFEPFDGKAFVADSHTVNPTALALRYGSNRVALVAGRASFPGAPGSAAVLLVRGLSGPIARLVPQFPASVGPLALGDVDGDGTLEVFVGARYLPGRYPQSGRSLLLTGRLTPEGDLVFDPATTSSPSEIEVTELVSGATFADVTGDGRPELLLACEWGPLRILRNEAGRLKPWNPPVVRPDGQTVHLADLTGWWNAVATGDLDGDGRLDVVAANWGRNTRFQRYLERPLRVYFGDLGHGHLELLEAYFEPALCTYAPWRDYDTVARSLPWVAERLPSFQAYGRAGVEAVLGDHAGDFRFLEAATLDTVLLLNRGAHFALRPLPTEVQFAPAFGVVIEDFDGDGAQDVFLAQNFFDVEPETSRYDAGRGLLLRGRGDGTLEPVPGWVSGLRIYGQQRGAAAADFDHDGRADLAVTQRGEELKLYRNTRARPGLRVRLLGPPGNPDGIGAVLRAQWGERLGPARSVSGGGGYWSQDSAVVLLTGPQPPTAVWVRWPGGAERCYPVPPGTPMIELSVSDGAGGEAR